MTHKTLLRPLRVPLLASATVALLVGGCSPENTISPPTAMDQAAAAPGEHRLVLLRPVLVTDDSGQQRVVHEQKVVVLTPVLDGEVLPNGN